MHSGDFDWSFFTHGFGLVFWIVVIVLIVGLVMGQSGRDVDNGNHSKPDAREILKERYAKGEIDRDEYESKMKDLDH